MLIINYIDKLLLRKVLKHDFYTYSYERGVLLLYCYAR
nr:MAG TPA: hypothetical protein [Caudoviricetes sp.]